MAERERWGSRLGLILAAAGNAIGIGNLLRFPGKAATNGGGAFMIPYVVSFVLFGLPVMWIAWAVGRFGGRFGHGTTPGMFDRMTKSPAAKYFGVLGVILPIVFCLYYTYIESWCLGYSFFSLTGDYLSSDERVVHLPAYLDEFLGAAPTHDYFSGPGTALVFVLITLGLNVFVLYRGVARGIELLAKIAVPLLFLFCVILVVKVFTLGEDKGTAIEGLSFLWTPKWTDLGNPSVWVEAAGQIFFTLSIGFGSLECYASYLRDKDDIALTGLTTASTNEFVEIIFGSMIAIPAAALFFGSDKIADVAEGGTFNIGMVSMPEVLRSFDGAQFFGAIWFLLLFLAAFTSSVAVCQPVMAFFGDEAKLKRGTAAMVVGIVWFLGTLPVIYFYKYGVLDELDFWAGTIGLVVFSMIEVILFAWIFGMDRGWKELHKGAGIRIPRPFYYVMKYITPVLLLALFCWWFYDAIGENKLIPTAKVNQAVIDQDTFPGDFEDTFKPSKDAKTVVEFLGSKKSGLKKKPEQLTDGEITNAFEGFQEAHPDWAPERWEAALPDVKTELEIQRIEGELVRAVATARRDLTAWVTLEITAEGTLTVNEVQGDPQFTKNTLTLEVAQRWFSLREYRYAVKGEPKAVKEITLAVQGLHRAPYIWLSRIMMVAFTVAFLVCIAVIWKSRGNTPETGGGDSSGGTGE